MVLVILVALPCLLWPKPSQAEPTEPCLVSGIIPRGVGGCRGFHVSCSRVFFPPRFFFRRSLPPTILVRACLRACLLVGVLRLHAFGLVLRWLFCFLHSLLWLPLFCFLCFFRTAGPREAHHPVRRAFRPQQLVVRGGHHASLQAGGGDGQARGGTQPHAGAFFVPLRCVSFRFVSFCFVSLLLLLLSP